MLSQDYLPVGYVQLTVGGTVVGLGAPGGAVLALLNVETTGVRWRDDGGPLSASVGMPIAAGSWPPLAYSGTLANFKLISQGAAATVDVTFYRQAG